jgi:hypothetical protein
VSPVVRGLLTAPSRCASGANHGGVDENFGGVDENFGGVDENFVFFVDTVEE